MATATIIWVGNKRSQEMVDALEKHYSLKVVPSGKQAIELALKLPIDAVVLDAVALETDGERICRKLRKNLPDTPLVHLHPGPEQAVDTPADILLCPPYTHRKLMYRLDRLVQKEEADVLCCGPFTMNMQSRILVAHGQEIPLNPKQAALAEIFMRHPGETLDRKHLMKHVWDTDYIGDTRTLDVHIRWLRQAIERGKTKKPHYLKTVRGVGYRLEITQ